MRENGDISRDTKLAAEIAEAAEAIGGRAYFVGGCVRDALMGRETKDIDVEIHGVGEETLIELLSRFGAVTGYGKSFGIYGVAGYGIDIALPRSEKRSGPGHRDFDVSVSGDMGTRSAAMRRDFTVNALMRDVLTGGIIDHFGGLDDLKSSVLRHVNDGTFADDPLRVLRAARFSAQLGFTVAEETKRICSEMDITGLSRERVFGETKLALTTSAAPSAFFGFLRSVNKLSFWFSELEALVSVAQDPAYHPEGDAYTHTMLVLDAAAKYRNKAKNALGFMLTALTHDFGKAVATGTVNGAIHAYGHEKAGIPLADRFLHRLTDEKELIRYVLNGVSLHMRPNICAKSGASVKSTNRLFDESVDPYALVMLAGCDGAGKLSEDNDAAQRFLLERLKIYEDTVAKPSVTGDDLIRAGIKPGAAFSDALAHSRKLHLSGVPKERALHETLIYMKKKYGITSQK